VCLDILPRRRNFNRQSALPTYGWVKEPSREAAGRPRRGVEPVRRLDRGADGAAASACGVGIRPERGPEPTRVQPAHPRTQDPEAGAQAAYAEVAERAAVRRRGGARARRAGGAWRRRWVRIGRSRAVG